MKTKTNLFKLCVLLFGISFLLWNCEDDNIIKPQSETEQRRLNISIVSFEHFKSVNAKALANIAPIKQEGLSQRIVESSMYDFFIDDERVQVIEKENYTTYTFNVLRDTVVEGELENYMYKEFNDGTYKQFLLTYYYSLDEDGEKVFNLTDMGVELIEDESLLNRVGDCVPHFVEALDGMNCTTNQMCTGYPGQHEVGDPCNCQITIMSCERAGSTTCEQNYSYTFDDCSTSGAGDNNPDDPNNPDTPNTGGAQTGNTNTNPGNTDAPPLDEEPDSYAEQIINCFNVEELGSNNNVTLNSAQLDWVNNTSNRDLVPLNSFLQSNNCSNEAQVLGAEAIDLLSLPELDQNLDIDTYETRILRMTTYLKQFGNPEDEFFADYVESIIPDFINMTVGDVYDIYKLTEEQTDNLIFKYFEAVVTPFAELAVAYIAFAVTEATLGGALPLLRRIPLAMVIQGNRLQKILKQVGLLGVQGQAGNHIRIVTTNGSAYTKALELFTSLTRNAQSITISANGTRVALFNGGNKIVFRIQSSSGFPATMELTFSEIWAQTRIIKFL